MAVLPPLAICRRPILYAFLLLFALSFVVCARVCVLFVTNLNGQSVKEENSFFFFFPIAFCSFGIEHILQVHQSLMNISFISCVLSFFHFWCQSVAPFNVALALSYILIYKDLIFGVALPHDNDHDGDGGGGTNNRKLRYEMKYVARSQISLPMCVSVSQRQNLWISTHMNVVAGNITHTQTILDAIQKGHSLGRMKEWTEPNEIGWAFRWIYGQIDFSKCGTKSSTAKNAEEIRNNNKRTHKV